MIDGSQFGAISAAAARFTTNSTDPKAVVIPSYQYGNGSAFAYVMLFYDGSAPPVGVFDDWLVIPTLSSDLATCDFASLIQRLGMLSPTLPDSNALVGSVNVYDYPIELLDFMGDLAVVGQ